MPNGTIRQTELAAALFHMIGELFLIHTRQGGGSPYTCRAVGRRSKILHKVVELCGTPTTPKQLFSCDPRL